MIHSHIRWKMIAKRPVITLDEEESKQTVEASRYTNCRTEEKIQVPVGLPRSWGHPKRDRKGESTKTIQK